jgi:hypothetical protein
LAFCMNGDEAVANFRSITHCQSCQFWARLPLIKKQAELFVYAASLPLANERRPSCTTHQN